MTKTILILAIAAAFVAGTITTTGMVYAHGGDVTLIHACVGKTLGIPRIVSQTTTCTKYENPLDWSIAGVPGPQGLKGDKGDPGTGGSTQTLQVTQRSHQEILPPNSQILVKASCEDGEVVTGGGFANVGDSLVLSNSRALVGAWGVLAQNDLSIPAGFSVVVECAKLVP